MKKLLIGLLLFCAAPALAQLVQQSGSVTPGHAPVWITNGVIGDGGTPAQGNLTGIGVTASGPSICANSGPITGPYNQGCLGVTQTGGLTFSLNNFAGATGGLTFSVNGVAQGIAAVTLPTTTNNFACFSNTGGNLKDCGSTPAGITVGSTTVASGVTNQLLYDNAGVLGEVTKCLSGFFVTDGSGVPSCSTSFPSGFTFVAPNVTGPLTLTTGANTPTQGFNITQTGGTSTQTGPQIFNYIKTTSQIVTSAGSSDPPFLTGYVTPFRSYFITGGNSVNSLNVGGYFRSDFTLSGSNTVSGDVLGTVSIGYANQSGPNGGGIGIAGSNQIGWIANGASWGYVAAIWAEVGLNPTFSGATGGAAAVNRYGIRITSDSTTQATTNDAATMWETNATFGSNAGKFANGILLGISAGNLPPISDSGNLINAGIQTTIGDILHFPSTTVSGDILNFPNVVMTGSGKLSIGTNAAPNAGTQELISCSSCGNVQVLAAPNGATGVDGLQAGDSAAGSVLAAFVAEASNTVTRFGQTAGNWGIIDTAGANSNGLMIGSVSAKPVIFGASNVETYRISSGGGGIQMASGAAFGWTASPGGTFDVVLGDGGAGTLRQGGADVASPIAQAFQIAGVAAGTSNTSGVNWTFKGSTSTGSANGGGFVWQTTPAGSSGTSQNTYSTALTIAGGSGNVGIGTETNPQYPLVVSANAKTGLTAKNVTGEVALFAVADGNSTNFEVASFGTGVNPAILMAGARGTGASPTASQSGDVLGFYAAVGYAATAYDSALASGMYVGAAENHTLTANGTFLAFLTVPTTTTARAEAMRVQGSGGLSIGATTDPGIGGLFVNGATITFNGLATDNTHTDRTVCQDTTSKSLFFGSGAAGICLGTSSEEYKHDIKPLPVGLAQILKMRPVEYYLNADHGDPDHLLYGFTAQREATNLPALVGHDGTGKLSSFDYMGVVPVLVKAIQELQQEVARLKVH